MIGFLIQPWDTNPVWHNCPVGNPSSLSGQFT